MYLHWFYLSNENGLLDSDTLHTAQLLSPRFTSIWKLLYVHSSPLQTFHNAPVSDIQDLNRGPLISYRWLLPLVLYISLREYASTLMLPRDGVTWWDIHPVLLNLEVSIGGGKGRQRKRQMSSLSLALYWVGQEHFSIFYIFSTNSARERFLGPIWHAAEVLPTVGKFDKNIYQNLFLGPECSPLLNKCELC